MQAIGHILPFAVAVALSSVPIMATIFILLSPNRSRSALPFLIGWVIGLFVVVSLCTLLAQVVPTARLPRQPDTAVGSIEIVVGLAADRPRDPHSAARSTATEHPCPSGCGPRKSQALGIVRPGVRLQPSTQGPAAGDRRRPHDPRRCRLADGRPHRDRGLYLVAASTVAVPIIATLAAPARMEPRLVRMRSG